ncbi:hypothetical protein GH714_029260 [Hevea brasiliensis]|uniref:Uncharacterized protein n=1 Tax=Hevea brasiliensis TaxID=3981 RepID=A0A6A6KJP9_HEVBR|nr:hypothetical protein GH714_029260 [Hevea brasiliensis]
MFAYGIISFFDGVVLLTTTSLSILRNKAANLSCLRSADGCQDGHDAEDPKQSTADMTAFVQNLLQQMQSRFQAMSDSIVTKNNPAFVHVLISSYLVKEMRVPSMLELLELLIWWMGGDVF